MKNTKKRKKPNLAKKNAPCPFCVAKKEPSYKAPDEIGKFLTDRARILGRTRSGVCAKHQRILSQEVKRARHLALLPFKTGI